MSLSASAVKARGRSVGFDLCGIARAARVPKLDRLESWIAEGRAGEMTYLRDSVVERVDLAQVLSSVRSIVSVGVLYNTDQPYSANVTDPDRVSIARYA